MARFLALVLGTMLCGLANAKIYFNENFDSSARWHTSEHKKDFGKMILSSGDFSGDAKINQGFKTSQDAHFYAEVAKIDTPVTNADKNLVVSLSVKHEQGLDCGGGYIKIAPTLDPKQFHGESEYFLMFGPDQCGYTKKVHVIFNYKGKNLLWKKEPRYPDDKLTHVYTLVVKPDNTYEMYIDQEVKESGKLEDDWAFLEPKEIDDATDKKPSDWVDDAQMNDPEDKKPADWDSEPEKIVDPEAKKPEDWDEEEDGKWEAPMIPNPKAKGPWSPKRIPNPAYKGEWKPKQIPNPAYVADDKLYQIRKPLEYVAIDIWQVKSGSIFDNIIIGDDYAEVKAIEDATWKATKDAEKTAQEAHDKKTAPPAEEPKADEAADDAKEDL